MNQEGSCEYEACTVDAHYMDLASQYTSNENWFSQIPYATCETNNPGADPNQVYPDSCCGTAPNLSYYNFETEICENGVLRTIELSQNYIGCYADQAERAFELTMPAITSEVPNAIEYCRDLCYGQQKQYFGLQYGIECFCGDSYDTYGPLEESSCNVQCADQSSETICGGGWANSVYEIII